MLPCFSSVAGKMNEPVVGPDPDCVHAEERRANGVDHAAMVSFLGIHWGKNAERRRNLIRRTREIGADYIPSVAACSRAEENIGCEVKSLPVNRREDHRHCANEAVLP